MASSNGARAISARKNISSIYCNSTASSPDTQSVIYWQVNRCKIARSSARNTVILQQYLNNKKRYGKTLVFAVNHRHTYTYPRIDTDKEGQFPFYQPYYLLIDMQLGGSWVGAVDPKELPVEMWVDWVKYYEKR